MIISASYKTDIPAFYGEWFMNRLRAGYCMMVNPYNRNSIRVDLSRRKVDAFVFWTKNLGPFMKSLRVVREMGYPFVVQYAITSYPRVLEQSVVRPERSAEHMRRLATEFGRRVAVWRYDTILLTSETPLDFHRRNFERLARLLEGTTDEAVVSFAQMYKKTKNNLCKAAAMYGFDWEDPYDDVKWRLAEELAVVAARYGMQLAMCSQRQYLAPGVTDARCVDAERLSELAERPIRARLHGNRPDCGCYASRDIGEYDTCPHGCVYCYAVQNQDLAKRRYRAHDPASEYLVEPSSYRAKSRLDTRHTRDNAEQLALFEEV